MEKEQLFIQQCFPNACYVLGTIPGTGHTAVSKSSPWPRGAHILMGKQQFTNKPKWIQWKGYEKHHKKKKKKLEQNEGTDKDGETFYQTWWSPMWPTGRIKADFAAAEERTRYESHQAASSAQWSILEWRTCQHEVLYQRVSQVVLISACSKILFNYWSKFVNISLQLQLKLKFDHSHYIGFLIKEIFGIEIYWMMFLTHLPIW